MIDRTTQEHLVGDFNAYFKAANKRRSKQMDLVFDEINQAAPDVQDKTVLKFLIEKGEETSQKKIVDFFNASEFIEWLGASKEPEIKVEVKLPNSIPEFAEEPEEIEIVEAKEPELPKLPQPEFKLDEKKANALGMFERVLAQTVLDAVAPAILEQAAPTIDEFIKKNYGAVTRSLTYEFPKHDTKASGIFHEEFETVLAFVEADEPVLLTGPAGTGKNHLCKQVAEALGLEFYFSNAVTQEYKLTGFTDANGTFHESQFYKAFTQGGLFMLDEMDASIPEVLIVLNAAIANRYFDFPAPVGKKEAHPDFRVIAGANTFGTGADAVYAGRYQLDGASLDRFAMIEIDYSPAIEESMTSDQELLDFIRAFRASAQSNGINCIVSYRSLSRMDKMSLVLSLEKTIKTCLTKGMEMSDLRMIDDDDLPAGNRWTNAFNKIVGF